MENEAILDDWSYVVGSSDDDVDENAVAIDYSLLWQSDEEALDWDWFLSDDVRYWYELFVEHLTLVGLKWKIVIHINVIEIGWR